MSYIDMPVGFVHLSTEPLEKYSKIDDLLNLNLSLPEQIRGEGKPVWVVSEQLYYTFKGGILDINFVPLVSVSEVFILEDTVNCTPTNNLFVVEHNLGNINVINVDLFDVDDNDSLLCGYYLGGAGIGEGVDTHITFKIAITIPNLRYTIYYTKQ